jgi:hypothetical protein
MINEIVDLIYKKINKSKENVKQYILDYFNNNNANLIGIYNLLLNNQNNSGSIFLLGYFNYYVIGTTVDEKRAFSFY